MQELTQEIREKLRAPFPAEAITQHPTKTYLSTIKAIYVTERLNDIFGIGGWDLEYSIISDTDDYVAVQGRIVVPALEIKTPMQFGGHGKTGKNTEPADGYKSAMTDCQSKCASYLEIGIDVFKGKVGSPKSAPLPKSAPMTSSSDTSRRICPFCNQEHNGQYPKCIECWQKEKNGETLVKTKTVQNEGVAPFKGNEFANTSDKLKQ